MAVAQMMKSYENDNITNHPDYIHIEHTFLTDAK